MATKTVAQEEVGSETRIRAARRHLLANDLEDVEVSLALTTDLLLESQLDGSPMGLFQEALVKLRSSRIVLEELAGRLNDDASAVGRSDGSTATAGDERQPSATAPSDAESPQCVSDVVEVLKRPVAPAGTSDVSTTDNFEVSAFEVMFGSSVGQGYRYVTNELSTLLATTEGKAGYAREEFIAALDQLRVRCGTAAEWSDRLERKAVGQ